MKNSNKKKNAAHLMSYNDNYALEKPELGPADNYFSRVCTKRLWHICRRLLSPLVKSCFKAVIQMDRRSLSSPKCRVIFLHLMTQINTCEQVQISGSSPLGKRVTVVSVTSHCDLPCGDMYK